MEALNVSTQTNLHWKTMTAWRIIGSQQFAEDPQIKILMQRSGKYFPTLHTIKKDS